MTAIIVPKVVHDLPLNSVPLDPAWTHLADLALADSSFGKPDKVDVLLSMDFFVGILGQGRRS